MLTRGTKLKLAAFAVVGIVVLVYCAVYYANLGRYIGLRSYYVVRLELTSAGGIYPDAEVAYRGVGVGRVGAVTLTGTGVQADLDISNSAPPIPGRLVAAVADLSAIGEQYVDLRPVTAGGPYLANGSVIPASQTVLPIPVTSVLTGVSSFAASVPLGDLRTMLSQFAAGFNGQTSDLQQMLDGGHAFLQANAASMKQVTGLINASKTVLQTQVDETSALTDFAASADLVARQLAQSDSDLRRLFAAAPGAARQFNGLLTDTNPALADLIANLLTSARVGQTRIAAFDELLSGVPPALVDVASTLAHGSVNVGLELTFFDPLPCTLGYGATVHRNGDVTSGAPLNTAAQCLEPPSSGIDVRGSANAPDEGGVPPAAQPGLVQLLGLG
jgi:phospholipid/cholesterol/gamma-HCH transport system substrate-binding protein